MTQHTCRHKHVVEAGEALEVDVDALVHKLVSPCCEEVQRLVQVPLVRNVAIKVSYNPTSKCQQNQRRMLQG